MRIDLKKIRSDKKLTQSSFSEITDIGQSYLSELENGRRDVSKEVHNKLVKAFGSELINKYIIEEHAEPEQPQISYSKGVPYYDVDFIGGFDLILNDQTVNPAYLIDFHKYNSADCWCNVTGNSMHPEITHGDIIALREIKEWSTFLPFGEVYAVVTEEHRTIKKITGGKNEDNFLLIPTNQSKEYKPQEVPKSIIRKVYRVLGCMKKI